MTTRRSLRADAERNRRQVVAAAAEVFAERGLDAPLDEIARRAGVGNATLYRRFPNRCDLVAAVFAGTLRDVVAAAERALADPDPWSGFAGHLGFVCELQAANRALADLFVSRITGVPELERLRDRSFRLLIELIERAKSGGVLRQDFGHEDVALVLMANAGLVQRMGDAAPSASRRFVSNLLHGLRQAPGDVPPAPARRDVRRAMDQLAARYGCAGPADGVATLRS
jgi:AcrR family transcriptional regulator